MSSNERKSNVPRTRKPLSIEDLTKTAKVVDNDLDALAIFDFMTVPRKKRSFKVTRVYRILYKRVNPKTNKLEYHDAILPEHRNPTGSMGHQLNGRCPKHVCTELCCTNAVRLVPVGCEDVLDKLIEWWLMTSKSSGLVAESILVEQDTYTAQEQVRASNLVPIHLYDYVQFMVSDMPVKQYEENGKTVWALL